MKNLVVFILFAILPSFYVFAQENDESSNETFGFHPIRIGISPSSFINLYPGIQISTDVGINKLWNVPIEVAFIHDIFAESDEIQRGRRIKIGIQHIFNQSRSTYSAIGINYLHRKTYAKELYDKDNQLFDGVPLSHETLVKQGCELTLAIGFKVTNRVTLEVGGGLGVSVHKNVSFYQNPNEIYYNFKRNDSYGKNETWPILSINLNVSYALRTEYKN